MLLISSQDKGGPHLGGDTEVCSFFFVYAISHGLNTSPW